MYKLFIACLSLVLIQACSEETSLKNDIHILDNSMTLLWELDGFASPESVIYDAEKDILYVSNISGDGTAHDGDGFISTVSTTGDLLEAQWVSGLNAPKGLAIHSGKLYVTDINELVIIDTDTGEILARHKDDNGKFFNDVTVAEDGKVYVSDMLTNTLYCLEGDSFGVWNNDEALLFPNGLHAEADHLIIGSWGKITEGFSTSIPGHLKTITYDSQSISSLGNGKAIGNLDGVEPYKDNFLVTDWIAGKLFEIDRAGHAKLLLEIKQGLADHEFIADKHLVLLPMMLDNTLLAFKLSQ